MSGCDCKLLYSNTCVGISVKVTLEMTKKKPYIKLCIRR